MATQIAEPTRAQDNDFSIGIVSASDNLEDVEIAVGLREQPTEEEVAEAERKTAEEAGPRQAETPAGETVKPGEEGAAGATEEEEPESGRFQKRIDTLTTKLANRDQHIDTLNQRSDALTKRLDALERGERTQSGAQPAADAPPAPKPFAFASWDEHQAEHPDSTYEDYTDARQDARLAHKEEAATVTATREAQQTHARAAEAAENTLIAENKTRVDQFVKHHPDFMADVEASEAPLTVTMNVAMMKSPLGPAVAQFIIGHPEEAQRIANLPDPFDQVREIARLDGHPDVVAAAGMVWKSGTDAQPGSGDGTPPSSASGGKPPTPRRRAPSPPAPLEPRKGGAGGSAPTLQDLGSTGENADAYIAERDRIDRDRGRRR